MLRIHQSFFTEAMARPINDPSPTYTIYLPLVSTQSFTPTNSIWDPRLDRRGAVLHRAQAAPGQGYWRLIKGVWFDATESQGKHNIFVDTLDISGTRQSGVPMLITWNGGATTIVTEAKPGEAYAADFPMFALAPSYEARPADNALFDSVDGMGLGDINDPVHGIHTSYGLTWQWTVAGMTPEPTITATLVPTITPTITATITPTTTITPTMTTTPTVTSAPTAPATPTPQASYLFQLAEVADCQPNDQGSRFEGYVKLANQPVAGYRVVFSYEPDGHWVTQPAITRSAPPGFYSHIISAGIAHSGNWFAWIVAENGSRISALANFTTGGPGGGCNVATVNFYGQ